MGLGLLCAGCNPTIQPLSPRDSGAMLQPPGDGSQDAAPPPAATDPDAATPTPGPADSGPATPGGGDQGDLSVILWRDVPGGDYQGTEVSTLSWMRQEVTVAQYRVCQQDGQCADPQTWSDTGCYWQNPAFDSYPVTCVTRTNAESYCDWLGARLPTVTEWNFAASSRDSYPDYPWGVEPVGCERAVIRDGEGEGCGTGLPWPGCSRPMGNTEQDICDMVGNVSEWSTGTAEILGGAFTDDAPAFHFQVTLNDPTYNNRFVGLRCVRP